MKYILIILLILSSVVSCSRQGKDLTIMAGKIDLSSYDFINNGPVLLNGQWKFYWNRLLVKDDPHFSLVRVPEVWSHYKETGISIFMEGAATYRLKIKTPDNIPLILRVPYIFSSYNVFINGKLEKAVGRVGLVQQAVIPKFEVSYIRLPVNRKDIDVVIQVSNFYHAKGGMRDAPAIGPAGMMIQKRRISMFIELTVFIILVVLSIYHFLHFFIREQDRAQLTLSATSMIFAIRVGFTGEVSLGFIFHSIDWFTQVRMEWLMPYLAPGLITMFFIETYKEYSCDFMNKILFGITVFELVFICLAPHIVFTAMVPVIAVFSVIFFSYLFYILIKALIGKKDGSKILFVGTFITILFIINDFFYASNIFFTGYYLNLGVLIFFLSYSWVISNFHSVAYKKLQQVTGELQALNVNLEMRVTKRTYELNKKNSELLAALENIKTLKGFIPICSSCKKIRDDRGYWQQVEDYIRQNSDAEMSHGLCPDCVKKLYPELTERNQAIKDYAQGKDKK